MRATVKALRQTVAAGALMLAACGSPKAPVSLDVEFAGCATVWVDGADRACAPSGETMTVWARTTATEPPAIELDGRRLSVTATKVQGGFQFTEVPIARTGVLNVVAGSGSQATSFALALRSDADLAETVAFDPKTAELETLRAGVAAAAPAVKARLLSRLGRRLLRTPEWKDGLATLREARLLHRQLGRSKDVIWDTLATAHMTTARTHDVAAAAALLQDLQLELKAAPEGAANAYYTDAVVAYTAGDPRRALALLAEARRAATRLAQAGALSRVAQLESLVYTAIGRFDDASRLAKAALDATPKPKPDDADARGAYAELQNNLAWALLRRRLGQQTISRITPELDGLLAEALSGFQAAKRPSDAADVIVNQGLLACARHDGPGAQAALDALEEAPASERRLLWRLELEGCAAMFALGDRKQRTERALSAFSELIARAELAGDLAAKWRGHTRTGQALRKARRYKEAVAPLELAEATVERHLFAVPSGAGRDAFVGDRRLSARMLVDMLIANSRPADAMAAARRARTRVLRMASLDAGVERLDQAERQTRAAAMTRYLRARNALDEAAANDWKLSSDELAAARKARVARLSELDATLDRLAQTTNATNLELGATPSPRELADGERVLALFPGMSGWFGFVRRGPNQPVVAVDLGQLPTQGLAEWALKPLANDADMRSLTLLTYGPLDAADLHAGAVDGVPLAARFPTAYAIDVPALPRATTGSKTLLVTDPSQDLAGARERGVALAKTMAGAATHLSGAEASGTAVRRELAAASTFFFAGHATHGGIDSADSSLTLAEGGQLRINDVLALGSAPASVVLAGCETARTSSEAATGLGLGQAFVMRGATAVVATTRPVRDDIAGQFTQALGSTASRDRYHGAVKALADKQVPTDQWSALRLWVP